MKTAWQALKDIKKAFTPPADPDIVVAGDKRGWTDPGFDHETHTTPFDNWGDAARGLPGEVYDRVLTYFNMQEGYTPPPQEVLDARSRFQATAKRLRNFREQQNPFGDRMSLVEEIEGNTPVAQAQMEQTLTELMHDLPEIQGRLGSIEWSSEEELNELIDMARTQEVLDALARTRQIQQPESQFVDSYRPHSSDPQAVGQSIEMEEVRHEVRPPGWTPFEEREHMAYVDTAADWGFLENLFPSDDDEDEAEVEKAEYSVFDKLPEQKNLRDLVPEMPKMEISPVTELEMEEILSSDALPDMANQAFGEERGGNVVQALREFYGAEDAPEMPAMFFPGEGALHGLPSLEPDISLRQPEPVRPAPSIYREILDDPFSAEPRASLSSGTQILEETDVRGFMRKLFTKRPTELHGTKLPPEMRGESWVDQELQPYRVVTEPPAVQPTPNWFAGVQDELEAPLLGDAEVNAAAFERVAQGL